MPYSAPRGSSMVAQDVSVVEAVRLSRMADSNRPTDKFPIGRLNYIGKHVYGYSGSQGVSNTLKTLFEDVSHNTKYIVAKIQFTYEGTNTTQDYKYEIFLNDMQVFEYIVGNSGVYTSPDNVVNLVIPPNTNIKLKAINLTDSSSLPQAVILVGEALNP